MTHHPAPTDRNRRECRLAEHRSPRPRLRWLLRRPPRFVRRLALAAAIVVALLVAAAPPAFAAGGPTLSGVISNLTNWIVGILAGVATLFLTIGGLRYLTAGGDPGQVEKAKIALKSAAIGYALAILAPLLVSILASLVGG
ncbi:MAG: pilin [Acidimicrobiales bacterium]